MRFIFNSVHCSSVYLQHRSVCNSKQNFTNKKEQSFVIKIEHFKIKSGSYLEKQSRSKLIYILYNVLCFHL